MPSQDGMNSAYYDGRDLIVEYEVGGMLHSVRYCPMVIHVEGM